jgi:MFS family permease
MAEEPEHGHLIVWILATGGILVALVQTIVAPLLPSATDFLHTDAGTASWMVTATLMTGCISNPIFGRLGDMYGKRRMVLVGLALLFVGSIVCALSTSIAPMIAGRALQGTALALTPLAVSILRDELPRHRVPGAVAVVGATIGTGAAIGYPVAGLTIQFANWHTLFWVTAVLTAVVAVMIVVFVPESPNRPGGRFDVLGALGLTVTLFLLLLGIERAADWGWLSGLTWGCLGGSVVAAALLLWHQAQSRQPLINVRASRKAPVLMSHVAALTVGFSFYANALATAQLVQEPVSTGYGLGESVLIGGLCVLPGGVAMVFLSPLSSHLARRFGPAATVQAGCVVMTLGYGAHVLVMRDGLVAIIVATSIVSCGAALAYSALSLLIMSVSPIAETGSANGINTLMRVVGQSACSAFTAASLGTFTASAAGVVRPELLAYQLVFVLAAGLAIVAAGCARAAGVAKKRRDGISPDRRLPALTESPSPADGTRHQEGAGRA